MGHVSRLFVSRRGRGVTRLDQRPLPDLAAMIWAGIYHAWARVDALKPELLAHNPQAIFFTPGSIKPYDSYKYMGCMIIGISMAHFLTYFPMWCAAESLGRPCTREHFAHLQR